MNTVTDTLQKSKVAAIIMQIRRPLTMRLIIFIRHPHMFTMSEYELHSCLIAKNENEINMVDP